MMTIMIMIMIMIIMTIIIIIKYIYVYKVSCIPLNVPRCHAVRCWRRIWEASSSPPSVEMPRCLWTPCFRVRGPSPLGWCKLSRSRYLCTNVGKTLDRVLEVDWGGNGFLFRVLFLKWRFDIFIFGFLTSILPISWGSSSVKDCGANPYSSARKSASSPESVHLRRREALCDSSAEIGCGDWVFLVAQRLSSAWSWQLLKESTQGIIGSAKT